MTKEMTEAECRKWLDNVLRRVRREDVETAREFCGLPLASLSKDELIKVILIGRHQAEEAAYEVDNAKDRVEAILC